MIIAEKVLQLVREKGPLVPTKLTGDLGQPTIIIGAILSDLASTGKIKVSALKVGGSPLYYTSEQASRLQEFTKYLNEKDQQSVELLRKKGIMRESELTPLQRVSLRNIKDFAYPLEVVTGETKEIFWKWYLLSDMEAEKMVREIIKAKEDEKHKDKEAQQEHKEKSKEFVSDDSERDYNKKEHLREKKSDIKKNEQEDKRQHIKTRNTAEKTTEDFIIGDNSDDFNIHDQFHKEVLKYFKQNNISIKEARLVKRNSEFDYIIEVPSSVGTIEYYCKARNKKNCNEGDLATAFVKGQEKKLPVLFLTTGALNKKAQEMLGKEFKGMKVLRMG
ncbi:MAG: hypothetical protein QXK37_05080 [Candidatus Woesearchaeota archaeon]